VKAAVRIAALLGLAVMIVLIAHEGAAAIVASLARAGWLLLWLVPLHALPLVLDVLGWRTLVVPRTRVATLFGIAAVREAFNRLLPVANIGGEFVGIRLLARRGVAGVDAAASVVVETLLTLISQYLYVALGLACLMSLDGPAGLAGGILIGLATSLPVVGLLIALSRYGSMFGRLQSLAERLLGERAQALGFLGESVRLDAAIRALYASRRRLATAVACQVLGLVAGASETWIALRWLGHPVGIAEAIVLESLTQAARSFMFLVPAGIGVQEAGLVGIGHFIGVGSDVAIALSLAKRMREILFGLPALFAWGWIEGRGGLGGIRARLSAARPARETIAPPR